MMVAKMPVVQNSIGQLQEALPVVIVGGDGNEAANPGKAATVGTVNADGTVALVLGNGANTMAQSLVGTCSVLALQITAITGSTVVVEVSNDAATWVIARGYNPNTGAAVGNMTATGIVQFNVAGFKYSRVRQSVYGSGTTTGTLNLGLGEVPVDINVVALPALPTGANIIGSAAAAATNSSTGGLTAATGVKRLPSAAATTNADFAKASAGRLYKVTGFNASAAAKYLKFYNKASAPTVGTDAIVWAEALPVGKFEINLADIGLYFSTGIAFALTGLPADADTTALAAGDVTGLNIAYA